MAQSRSDEHTHCPLQHDVVDFRLYAVSVLLPRSAWVRLDHTATDRIHNAAAAVAFDVDVAETPAGKLFA